MAASRPPVAARWRIGCGRRPGQPAATAAVERSRPGAPERAASAGAARWDQTPASSTPGVARIAATAAGQVRGSDARPAETRLDLDVDDERSARPVSHRDARRQGPLEQRHVGGGDGQAARPAPSRRRPAGSDRARGSAAGRRPRAARAPRRAWPRTGRSRRPARATDATIVAPWPYASALTTGSTDDAGGQEPRGSRRGCRRARSRSISSQAVRGSGGRPAAARRASIGSLRTGFPTTLRGRPSGSVLASVRPPRRDRSPARTEDRRLDLAADAEAEAPLAPVPLRHARPGGDGRGRSRSGRSEASRPASPSRSRTASPARPWR